MESNSQVEEQKLEAVENKAYLQNGKCAQHPTSHVDIERKGELQQGFQAYDALMTPLKYLSKFVNSCE